LPLPSSERPAPAAGERYAAHQLESQLGRLLEAVLSLRRTVTDIAESAAMLDRDGQAFVLHWTGVIARTNVELAFQFATAAPGTLARIDRSQTEAWVIHAIDAYDRDGLQSGTEALRETAPFEHAAAAVEFDAVARVLQLFVQGLSGRPLPLETAREAYTDTDTIFLPNRISRGATCEENFLHYKATVALLWAQTRHGTYSADLEKACNAYPDPRHALHTLNALEAIRLEAHIERELPGLARATAALRGEEPIDERCVPLLAPSATVEDSIRLIGEFYACASPPHDAYASVLQPGRAAAVRERRIAREKKAIRDALARLREEMGGDEAGAFTIEEAGARELSAAGEYVLELGGVPVSPPAELARLIDSVVQDLGQIPEDYLAIAGDAQPWYASRANRDALESGNEDQGGTQAYRYDEWDHARGHYRRGWCMLRETDVQPGDDEFVKRVYAKHASNIARLKRTFELVRGEERLLKRQPEGDGIDLDALVEGYCDMNAGTELPPLLFTRRRKIERDLAVMFMVDMSGSTKGWINEAEREALVMLCEALEALGDRYAIYGFSGITRRRCEVFRVKRFDEPYGALVRSRIAGIEPQDYTRMGAAIRHLTMRLDEVEARTKLLVTLSDGKPEDYSDNYRGEYGIEDTRQALLEAHKLGIRPFCITIDHEARDYLPHMYGAVNWTLVNDADQLPEKVAEIYRRLSA